MTAVTIGPLNFKSAKAAVAHYLRIRDKYKHGHRLSKDDAAQLMALLEATDWDWSLATLDHFEVRTAHYGTMAFRIVRKDGKADVFSVRNSIANLRQGKKAAALIAQSR